MVYMRTFCFCFDTKKGSIACGVYTMVLKVIAVVGIIFTLAVLPAEDENRTSHPELNLLYRALRAILMICFIYCLTFLIFCGLLIYGVKKDRSVFLLPWIVAMSVEVAISMFSFFFMFFMATGLSDLDIGASVGCTLFLIFFIGFGIYMILCVESVRKLLKHHSFYPPIDAIKLSQPEEDCINIISS